MARRRLTIKRLDPWSVLKFGIFANLVLFGVFMLMAGVVWFIVDRLQLVDQACELALDVGFTTCGVNAGNLFQALALLGGMWVIVQTAVLVFLAFLYNLIADLTGGLVIGVVDDSATSTGAATATGGTVVPTTGRSVPVSQEVRPRVAEGPQPTTPVPAAADHRPASEGTPTKVEGSKDPLFKSES